MIVGVFALVAAAMFSGAAIYVLAVERVARAELDDRAALAEWTPAYKRGTAMQAPLALVGVALGAFAWWQTGDARFAIGAVMMLLPWPWTLLVIKPTNDRLLSTPPDAAGSESRALIARWGRLHAVRTLLGCGATVAFVAALALPQ
jgi:hypothetical protein